jgi:antitoxin component of MazEF toxin-antitoxin module
MGNVPYYRRSERRLTKNSSGTVSVSLPIEVADQLGWQKGQRVTVEKHGDEVVIKLVSDDDCQEAQS